jgi:Skp family chaperone for outer membrane proteins
MASRPPHSKLLAQGTAILALGLLVQPCLAQTSQIPPKPVAKEADGSGVEDARAVHKKANKATSPLRIAVVDMDQAIRAHPLFETRSKELAEWLRAQSAKLNELKKTMQSKQTQLNNTVQPGSEAAEELELELRKLDVELKYRRQLINQTGMARDAKLRLGLQDQVNEAIAEFAPKRGILLVLRRRVPVPKAGLQRQYSRSELTDVLYAADTLDITQDIIDFLKTKYPPK